MAPLRTLRLCGEIQRVARKRAPTSQRVTQRTARKRLACPERPLIHRRDSEKRAASAMAPLRPLRLCGEIQHVARKRAPTSQWVLTT
jgi:hypothetical protein